MKEPQFFRGAVKRLLEAFNGYMGRPSWEKLEKSLIHLYHDSVFCESVDRATGGTTDDSNRNAELLNLGVLSLGKAVNTDDQRVYYRFQGLASRYALAALFFRDQEGGVRADPLLDLALEQLKQKATGGGEKFERLFARGLQVGSNSWDLSRAWVSLAEMPLFAEAAKTDRSLWCYSLRVLTFKKHAADEVLGWLENGSYEEGSFMAECAGPDVAAKAPRIPSFALLSNAARQALDCDTETAYSKFVSKLPAARLVLTQCKLFEAKKLAGKERDHAVNTTNPAFMFDTKAGKRHQPAVGEFFSKSPYAAQCLRVLFVGGGIAAPGKIERPAPPQHLVVCQFAVNPITALVQSLRNVFQPPWPPCGPSTPPSSRTNSEASPAGTQLQAPSKYGESKSDDDVPMTDWCGRVVCLFCAWCAFLTFASHLTALRFPWHTQQSGLGMADRHARRRPPFGYAMYCTCVAWN